MATDARRLDSTRTAVADRLPCRRESRASRAAGEASRAIDRRASSQAGCAREGPGASRASRRGRHRDSGHAAALVPKSGDEKVRRFPVQNRGASENCRGDREAGRTYGHGESRLGIHPHSRSAVQPGSRYRSKHDQACLDPRRLGACSRAQSNHELEDLPKGGLGRDCRGRLLCSRSLDSQSAWSATSSFSQSSCALAAFRSRVSRISYRAHGWSRSPAT